MRILKAVIFLGGAGLSGAFLFAGHYVAAIIAGLAAIVGAILIRMELSRGTPESESQP